MKWQKAMTEHLDELLKEFYNRKTMDQYTNEELAIEHARCLNALKAKGIIDNGAGE